MDVFKAAVVLAATLACLTMPVTAGFNPSSSDNLAIYWGQNSYQQPTGQAYSQERLSYYCSNTNIDIIPLAFLTSMSSPSVNFANAGDNCTVFSGTTLLSCPQLEEDIQTCQSTYGKTILLSIGGATYTEGGFSSESAATAAADNIWAMFGPVQSSSSVNRPFGNAVVDGFDADFESSTSNLAPFASELRSKMDAATAAGGKNYYLSAAPQCPYPDAADNDMLDGAVYFDFIMIQFYNNYCGLQSFVSGSTTQDNFDYSTWDNWANTVSKNPDVRILLGIPGSATAAGSGYESGSTLSSIITYAKQYSSFGGVMIWDMSQIYANSGFLDQVVADLGSGSTTTSKTSSSAGKTTTSTSKHTSATTVKTTTTTTANTPKTTTSKTTSKTNTSTGSTKTSAVTSTTSTTTKNTTPTRTTTSTSKATGTTTKTTGTTTSTGTSRLSTGTSKTSTTHTTTTATGTTKTTGATTSTTSTPKTTVGTTTSTTRSTKTTTGTTVTGTCSASTVVSTKTVTSVVTIVVTSNPGTTTAIKTTLTTKTTSSSSSQKTTSKTTSTAVPQWGQCGGTGYTGSTTCASPYKCVANSVWWSQCQ